MINHSGSEALLTLFTVILLLLGVEYYLLAQPNEAELHPLAMKVTTGILRLGAKLRLSFLLTYLGVCTHSSPYPLGPNACSPFVRMDHHVTKRFNNDRSDLLFGNDPFVPNDYDLLAVSRFGRRQSVRFTHTGRSAS